MNTYLAITALGTDKPGLVNAISEAVMDCGGNIEDSRMIAVGGEFAAILLVTGNWSTIAKLESSLGGLGERLSMRITSKRTEPRSTGSNLLPYSADVVALDHPGIVYHLANFFSSRDINIQEMHTESYRAAHTGTPMFSAHLEVDIPAEVHIAELREQFLDFCDQLNLDAVIEPIKG